MLTPQEKQRLQNLMAHQDYGILVKFAQELKAAIGSTPVVNTSEWDFVKSSLQKEFQIAFVDEFLRLVEEEANA